MDFEIVFNLLFFTLFLGIPSFVIYSQIVGKRSIIVTLKEKEQRLSRGLTVEL